MLRRVSLVNGAPRARLAAVLIAAALLLLAVPVALAAWITVDTNNNQADSFGAPFYTSTCSNANIADHLEIKNAWLAFDGTAVYYKLETCGTTTGYTSIRFGGGWDCNNDGDFADPVGTPTTTGDRKAALQPGADIVWLVDGGNTNLTQLQGNQYSERPGGGAIFEWQMPMQYVYPDCRASDPLVPAVNPGGINMGIGTGEISGGRFQTRDTSSLIRVSNPIDYGDANNPNPAANPPTCTQYPNRIGCDGARHGINSPLILGAAVDADGGNLYNTDATADDLRDQDDEDGVSPTAGVKWTAGGQGSLNATVTGGSGYLNCWVDWNNDQDWADAGEKIISDVAAPAGPNTLTFGIPASAAIPNAGFIARCRLSPGTGQATAVTGATEFGEVEDHKWSFDSAGFPVLPAAPSAVTDLAIANLNTTDVRLTWTNPTPNDKSHVLGANTPYFTSCAGACPVDMVVDTAPWQYDHLGVRGGQPDTFYYIVYGRLGSTDAATPSNRVGLFEFALTQGTP